MSRTAISLFFLGLSLLVGSLASPVDPEANAEPSSGVNWVLIIAGSNGWYNYRHQADACHAYQIVHKYGIPDERVVVMMYDDLAYNQENPTPGIIINRPNGTDVYHGVLKDYTGQDVTPDNFLNILQGNAAAMMGIGSGKVIASGPNDHIFVNFADHGAPGLVAFPAGGELHASDLNSAIQSMFQQQKYAKMTLYFEACESGSMFENLPTNINVFATTASNADESSYACYYDAERSTYLGDVYSVMWMEDSDMEDVTMWTLQQQFEVVRKKTNTSHVMEYGDLSMGSLVIDQFQGGENTVPRQAVKPYPRVSFDAVPAPDVPMAILQHRLAACKTTKERQTIVQKMSELLKMRSMVTDTVRKIVDLATDSFFQASRIVNTKKTELHSHYCYKAAVRHFADNCFSLNTNDYPLRHLYVFVNMCEEKVPLVRMTEAIDKVCGTQLAKFMKGIN